MNATRNLLTSLCNLLLRACEAFRYGLTFLRAILCSRAVLAAKLPAAESQLAACKRRIDSKSGVLEFDSIDDFISAPAPLNPANGPFSVLVWVKGGTPAQGIISEPGGPDWLSLDHRATIVGHAGTAGAYGSVGLGQYKLPGDLDLQFPTGRPETMDGQLLIEGTGVLPDVVVPVTYESALGLEDPVLLKAIELLTGN